jgi:hemoglobin
VPSEPKLNFRLYDGQTLFTSLGGIEACRRLSESFHLKVWTDPVLRPLFPTNIVATTDRFTLFVGERLGGPADYRAKRGKQSLGCRHAHLSIGSGEAERWLGHMFEAIDEVGICDPARRRLRDYFTETAKTLTDPFVPLYRLPLVELHGLLKSEAHLTMPCEMGHSLLSDAVRRWDVARVQLLLEFGACPNEKNLRGHGPLYHACNSRPAAPESEGRSVVDILIRSGAALNATSGPGKSTPLHMTARRGHVLLAEALLDAGADIEKGDSKGETALRRAVNCGQEAMVALLLSHGASRTTQDLLGRTPIVAARHERIREVLRSLS